MMTRRLLRNNPWDIACLAVIPFQASVYLSLAYNYQTLSLWFLIGLVPIFFLLSIQTAGASHNHYHTPFFTVRWMNIVTRMGYSMIAYPKTPFDLGHGIHHALHESWNDASIFNILGIDKPITRQFLRIIKYIPESLGAKYIVLLYLVRRWDPESPSGKLLNPLNHL